MTQLSELESTLAGAEQWRLHVRQLEEELGKARSRLESVHTESDKTLIAARLDGDHPAAREAVVEARAARTAATIEVDELETALVHARAQLVDAERKAAEAELQEKHRAFSRLIRQRLRIARKLDKRLDQLNGSLQELYAIAAEMEPFGNLVGLDNNSIYPRRRAFGRVCRGLEGFFGMDMPSGRHYPDLPLAELEGDFFGRFIHDDDGYKPGRGSRSAVNGKENEHADAV